LACFSLFGFS